MKVSFVLVLVPLALVAASLAMSISVHADEGMWVFNNLPLEQLKARYGFEPPPGWAEHLRSAAVRFNNGGSGSFVSADGLIMTNHHVGADTLAKLGTATKDYYRDGFFAQDARGRGQGPRPRAQRLGRDRRRDRARQPRRHARAWTTPRPAESAAQAMAEIEKEATEKNGLRNDVVTLYQGGQYHLYTYKKYTDVRLVFAPEFDIAFFGGDPDNFEYPRYDLDVCFFRAYEDGKPARIEHYLKWSKSGSKEGDLVFVAGHPGRTDRLNTVASLEYLRDVELPFRLDYLKDREAFLLEYGRRGPEAFRQAKEDLFSVQNSRKARIGGLEGLRDPIIHDAQGRGGGRAAGQGPGRSPAKHADGRAAAWDKIAAGPEGRRPRSSSLTSTSSAATPSTRSSSRSPATWFGWPRRRPSPTPSGSDEYRESALKSLELKLFSEAPIYPEYEEAKLAHSLAHWKQVDARRSAGRARLARPLARPAAAKQFVERIQARRRRVSGASWPREARRRSRRRDDPMIKLALAVDADARAVRKIHEDQVEGVERPNYASIAKALFDEKGDRRLSRRDFHPPAGVRRRSRATRSAASDIPALHHDRRRLRARQGPRQHAPLRAPQELVHGPRLGQAQPGHAAQLRLDGRHHRRQLGQPGRQPRQRGRRPDLRRQHPVAGPRLRLRRPGRPGRLGRFAGNHRGPAVDLPRRSAGRGADGTLRSEVIQ